MTFRQPVTATGWFLVGPTASGKTEAAHILAQRMGIGIISADAMLVYRGMDIGTAKPNRAERKRFAYLGIDLIDPAELFSVGAYRAEISRRLQASPEHQRLRVVTGGTGLYVRALIEGLGGSTTVCLDDRRRTNALLQKGGLSALQDALSREAPGRLERLADPDNPRRVARALEQAWSGGRGPQTWSHPPRGHLVGLRWDSDELATRIEQRVVRMFQEGLLEEAAALAKQSRPLSVTARKAIGYREAFSVLEGTTTIEQATAQTAARTRALARRQRTWFRHQSNVAWVDVTSRDTPEQTADRVEALWKRYGPVEFSI